MSVILTNSSAGEYEAFHSKLLVAMKTSYKWPLTSIPSMRESAHFPLIINLDNGVGMKGRLQYTGCHLGAGRYFRYVIKAIL